MRNGNANNQAARVATRLRLQTEGQYIQITYVNNQGPKFLCSGYAGALRTLTIRALICLNHRARMQIQRIEKYSAFITQT